jgi:adenosylhomocysteine nucleosidase
MIVVIISAGVEWDAIIKRYREIVLVSSPFGKWFEVIIESSKVIFFYGGWGKISAASSAQYVIDNFKPSALVNLGTCGGFEGKVEVGTIIMANKTVVYDIYERMRDSKEDIEFYTTNINLGWLKKQFSFRPVENVIVSADADIDPDMVKYLHEEYGAVGGDWESAAIAYVCGLNNMKCLVLRGVSDLISNSSGEAYGNYALFKKQAGMVMDKFVDVMPEIINTVKMECQ